MEYAAGVVRWTATRPLLLHKQTFTSHPGMSTLCQEQANITTFHSIRGAAFWRP
jgi:hypothetical protein